MKKADLLRRIYLIIVLGFISHYVGTIGMDPSLLDGKNLATFLFLYVIGDTLHHYESKWKKIPNYWYGISFLILNVSLIIFFTIFTGRIFDIIYTRVFFSYCSFGLLLSSVLFFIWIGGMKIKSKFINYIAKSSLSIYMIHGANLIFLEFIGPTVLRLLDLSSNEFELFIMVFLFTLAIVICCIAIDKLLTPVWHLIDRLGESVQNKVLSCRIMR